MVYVGKLVNYMWNVEHREKNICQSQVEDKIVDGNPVELQELLIINHAGLMERNWGRIENWELGGNCAKDISQSHDKAWDKSSGILWNRPLSIY